MLFESQREELVGTKHTLYYAGAAYMRDDMIAFVTGARTKQEPYTIIVSVEYLGENGSYRQAFSNELIPSEFEKFLYTFENKVKLSSRGEYRMKEVRHVFRSLDDDKYDLDETGKNAALYVYLDEILRGQRWEKALSYAESSITRMLVK